MAIKKTVRMLGTRGVPASYGGFESCAHHLALHLIERGWRVIVYCQEEGEGPITEDVWNGVERVVIPSGGFDVKSTIKFDWKATRHAARFDDLCLVFGYNTGLFQPLLRIKGITHIVNMDGVEWARDKWSIWGKSWLWINDRIARVFADHLVSDHPSITDYLVETGSDLDNITLIAYGADLVTEAPTDPIVKMGLEPGRYLTLICRTEPENSILEIVQGFSRRRRGLPLVVLGNYDDSTPFLRAVRAAASDEVIFPGAIYDKQIVHSLRFHCLAYMHGHRVGGTNPSLVEALGAGNAVVAHNNRFNRWVAQDAGVYFTDAETFDATLTDLLQTPERIQELKANARARFLSTFTWQHINGAYEVMLERFLDKS